MTPYPLPALGESFPTDGVSGVNESPQSEETNADRSGSRLLTSTFLGGIKMLPQKPETPTPFSAPTARLEAQCARPSCGFDDLHNLVIEKTGYMDQVKAQHMADVTTVFGA